MSVRRRGFRTGPGSAGWAARWPQIAADWRRKQLEYSWLRAVAGAHVDFWQVTQDELKASGAGGVGAGRSGAAGAVARALLGAVGIPEVPMMLAALADQGKRLAILSNGSPGMLEAAVHSAGLDGVFEALLSVESVGVFKPHSRVYDLVGSAMGVTRARFCSCRRTAGMPARARPMALSPPG